MSGQRESRSLSTACLHELPPRRWGLQPPMILTAPKLPRSVVARAPPPAAFDITFRRQQSIKLKRVWPQGFAVDRQDQGAQINPNLGESPVRVSLFLGIT